MIWFFFAEITLYQNATTVTLTGDGYAQAQFNDEDMRQVRRGQTALVRADGEEGDELGVMPGIVTDTRFDANPPYVELYLPRHAAMLNAYNRQLTGTARVEIETLSPFMLVMRASGQFIDDTDLVTSPQNADGLQGAGG